MNVMAELSNGLEKDIINWNLKRELDEIDSKTNITSGRNIILKNAFKEYIDKIGHHLEMDFNLIETNEVLMKIKNG